MTAAAPASLSTTVHIEIPHFTAIYEGAVAWDACGPVANEVAVAALEGRTPDTGNAAKARARDLAAGHFTVGGGQPLSGIIWDLQQRGYTALEIIPYGEPANNAALHDLVKKGALAGLPVILQVARAYNLPDNEANVQYHFVVVGGIDSVAGYLLANGDTKTGIARHPAWPAYIPTNWATWATITAAGVCGAILVKPKPGAPHTPAGWTDDGAMLHAPNGGSCGHGIRWAVLTTAGGWDASLEPVTGEFGDPSLVSQDFRTNGDPHAAGVRLTWHASDGSVTSSPLDAITPPPPPAPAPAPTPTPAPEPAPTPTPVPEPTPAPEPASAPVPIPDPVPDPTAAQIAALTAQVAQLTAEAQAATAQAQQAVSEAVAASQAAAQAATTASAAQNDVAALRAALKAL